MLDCECLLRLPAPEKLRFMNGVNAMAESPGEVSEKTKEI